MKNPLGVLALFVTFIDGIAGLVISVNFENLHGAAERLPLIWFIIGFPVLILATFVILVIRYNEKLYAPKDFDNQDGFLIANGKSVKPNEEPKPLKKPENIPVRNNWAGICMKAYSSSLRTRKMSDQKIQEAALQRYADENNMEIKTEVQIDRNLICDGIAEKNNELYLFEVKVNCSSATAHNAISTICRISDVMTNKGCPNVHVVLILVSKDKLSSSTLEDLYSKSGGFVHDLEIVNYTSGEIESK